ncbi:molybdenum ABC transporter ATP-binding protein [Thiohalobacter sp. IOR34]|uniref:molybdenum ABC transporter ATP-binding protein n=1 Tax=Thiohalobacter sp. IOR34 TaxID=3057176 RepID=UPI0025B0C5F2|nr:molybdenum ABC transporter ATP-binding protein [Thiohalobacter sp. IOR34]WJW76543.1 molybdenum ABC transporter ATP-binding protein [Thiohalobacter sp. IOR34]
MSIEVRFRLPLGSFELDVDFSIPARGVTALFGPSGCGKTTCLRCIAGLERPFEGRLSVAGRLWQDSASGRFLDPHRRPLGYVFQDLALFPHLSVRANLEYGYRRLEAARRRLHPPEVIELLGLGSLLERSPLRLSGGERQRVALGRALLTSPELLLLDEPLSALDDSSKAEIMPYLERLHRELEMPSLYVSHSLDEVARLADRVVLMEAGQVRGQGPVGELFTRLDLPPAHRPQAAAIIEAEVRGQDGEFCLTELGFSGGRLRLPCTELPVGTAVRVVIHARDVSLGLQRATDTSILNIIEARVTGLSEDGPAQMLVRLDAGGQALLSRITRKSAVQLGLRPGLALYAQIKSVALL